MSVLTANPKTIEPTDWVECPFCQRVDIAIGTSYGVTRKVFGFCKFCGSEGPKAYSESEAIDAWNMCKPATKKLNECSDLVGADVIECLESMARQHCYTSGKKLTDCGAISSDADALEMLHELGRFRVAGWFGKTVNGYWPENDPEAPTKKVSEACADSQLKP